MEHAATPQAHQHGRAERGPLRNRRFLIVLLVILLGFSVWIARPLIAAIVFAIVFGYVLHPAYERLLKLVRYPWISAGLMLLLVAAAFAAPLAYLGYRFVAQATQIQESVGNGLKDDAVETATSFGVSRAQAEEWIQQAISQGAAALQGLVVDALRVLPELVIGLVVFFILLYFTFVHGNRMVDWFRENAPLAEERREKLLAQTGQRVRAILLGTFFVSALQGVSAGLGWWLFGFPAPVFWGFVMTVMAILPFLGAQMITIPAGIYAIVQGDTFGGVGLIVYTLIVVSLIDDLVRPWIIGKQAGVHPGLILVGTLGGLQVLGIAGLILGPLALGLIEPVLRAWRDAAGPPRTPREEAPPDDDAREMRRSVRRQRPAS